jgi:hypothetical protein
MTLIEFALLLAIFTASVVAAGVVLALLVMGDLQQTDSMTRNTKEPT